MPPASEPSASSFWGLSLALLALEQALASPRFDAVELADQRHYGQPLRGESVRAFAGRPRNYLIPPRTQPHTLFGAREP